MNRTRDRLVVTRRVRLRDILRHQNQRGLLEIERRPDVQRIISVKTQRGLGSFKTTSVADRRTRQYVRPVLAEQALTQLGRHIQRRSVELQLHVATLIHGTPVNEILIRLLDQRHQPSIDISKPLKQRIHIDYRGVRLTIRCRQVQQRTQSSHDRAQRRMQRNPMRIDSSTPLLSDPRHPQYSHLTNPFTPCRVSRQVA